MTRLFSASTVGLYEEGDTGVPDDAVKISDALYEKVKGQHLVVGSDGLPALYDPSTDPAEVLVAIAARRYQAETAGISVGGMRVDTGRDSQGLINGAALSAYMDDTYTCNWKTAGGFAKLDAKTILAVASAVRNHVQTCFDREAVLVAAVQGGTYKPEMLEQGWPS